MNKYFAFTIIALFYGVISLAQPTGLKEGDRAPLFTAKTHSGNTIRLKSLLKKGPVVLFFYRGSWCPYCNKQMAQLQDSINYIIRKGGSVVGITPETEVSMNKIILKSKASFPLIHDKEYHIMKAYDVSFTVDTATISKYKKYNIDLEKSNGNTQYVLPVPATYVIGTNGIIKFVYFNKDYTKRASVSEILTHL